MSLELRRIESSSSLRNHAEAWDNLWQRSEIALPTKRAAMLDQWLAHFAAGQPFIGLVVTENNRWLAALPLVEGRLAKTIRIGRLPVNCWCSSGDILLDTQCDQNAVLARLVAGFRSLPWPILWFDTIETEMPRWLSLRRAMAAHGLPIEHQTQFDLGLIDVGNDWAEYKTRWSKSHRKQIARWLRRLREQGKLELIIYRDISTEMREKLLLEGFEIEHRSWKGPAGTSVLGSSGMLEFFCEQARQLASWEQLELVFLRFEDRPIAFEFGYHAKGTYFSHKVGYDAAYRRFAPGQLLMALQLESYHSDPDRRMVNCMGMLSAAVAKWSTRTQPIGRLVIGTGGTVGNGLMRIYHNAWPVWHRLRG